MSEEMKVLETTITILEELLKLAQERKKRIETDMADEASRAADTIHTAMAKEKAKREEPSVPGGYAPIRPYKEEIKGVLMVFVNSFVKGPVPAGAARCYKCMALMERADDLKSCPKCGGVLKGRGKMGGLTEIE